MQHISAVWPVSYACVQPYYPGSRSHVVRSWRLKGCFASSVAVQSYRGLMLMKSNKHETPVHGCHGPSDMAVRMRHIVGMCSVCLLLLFC